MHCCISLDMDASMLMAWLARATQARVKVFANICVVGFKIVSYSNWNKAAFIAKLSEDEDPIGKKSLTL